MRAGAEVEGVPIVGAAKIGMTVVPMFSITEACLITKVPRSVVMA